jgi:hypothetical protein
MNWSRGIAVGSLILSLACLWAVLQDEPELGDTRSSAVYMPGGACVIRATESTTPALIVTYARQCAAAHRDWMEQK